MAKCNRTVSAKRAGEQAIDRMSEKAQKMYNETDPCRIWEYEEIEDDSDEEILLYDVDIAGDLREGLSFEEADAFLASSLYEEEEDDK